MAASTNQTSRPSAAPLLALGVVILATHITNLLWWNTAFNRGATQAERVAIYHEGLPAFLSGLSTSVVTWLQAALALIGVLAALPAIRHGTRPLAITGKLVAPVNGLFLLWYLFTLM